MNNTPNGSSNRNSVVSSSEARFITAVIIFVLSMYARSCAEQRAKTQLEAEQAKQEEIREAERARDREHAEEIRAKPVPEEKQHFAAEDKLQQIEKPGDLVFSLPNTWDESIGSENSVNFKRCNDSGLLTITWEPTQWLLYTSAEEAVDHVTSRLDSIVLEDEEPETGKIGEALWYRYPVYSHTHDDGEALTYGYLELIVSGRDMYSIVVLSRASTYSEEINGEFIRILNSMEGVTDPPQSGAETTTAENDAITDDGDSTTADSDATADTKMTAAQDDGPMAEFLVSLGDFKTFTVRGTGNDIIDIPDVGEFALFGSFCHLTVTFDSEGRNTLVRQSQDPEGGSLTLVDHTGPYFGIGTNISSVEDTITQRQLAVTTDGNWSIVFAPMSATERLVSGATYTGDNMLYLSAEPVSKLHITYEGDGAFHVSACGMEGTKRLVDTRGPYDDEVVWEDPDTLFLIGAEGNWSISW